MMQYKLSGSDKIWILNCKSLKSEYAVVRIKFALQLVGIWRKRFFCNLNKHSQHPLLVFRIVYYIMRVAELELIKQ